MEIEERLLAHPSIGEASVVGMPDERYGEVVSCFLRQAWSGQRPIPSQISEWVSQVMGRHKAPKHVWWIRDLVFATAFRNRQWEIPEAYSQGHWAVFDGQGEASTKT